MFKQSDQTITINGTVRLTQPLPDITKKRRWGGPPKWHFEVVPANDNGHSAKPVTVEMNAGDGWSASKGLVIEGHDVEVTFSTNHGCACGHHITKVINHTHGWRWEPEPSAKADTSETTDESNDDMPTEARTVRGIVRASHIDEIAGTDERSGWTLYHFTIVPKANATDTAESVPLVVCGKRHPWFVHDQLRDADPIEVIGRKTHGVIVPQTIKDLETSKPVTFYQRTSTALSRAEEIRQTVAIVAFLLTAVAGMLSLIGMIFNEDSALMPVTVFGLVTMVTYLVTWVPKSDKSYKHILKVWSWTLIGAVLIVALYVIALDARSAIAIMGEINSIELMANPRNAPLLMSLSEMYSQDLTSFATNLAILFIILTPIVSYFIYRRLFSEPAKERIKLEGIAQNVDVRTVAAQPIEFLGKFLNFGNIEVLSFRLLTKASVELARFVPAKFMQSTDSNDQVLVGVEMRGHLEGMVKDGDELAFEASSNGYVLSTEQIGNVSTLSTVRAKQAPQWIYFLVIIAVVFLVGLFLREQIIGVVQGMAASALPPPTPTP